MGRSQLTRYAPLMREAQPEDALRAAREAYLKSEGEMVLISKKWLKDWTDQKQLDLLAVKALRVKGEGK